MAKSSASTSSTSQQTSIADSYNRTTNLANSGNVIIGEKAAAVALGGDNVSQYVPYALLIVGGAVVLKYLTKGGK
jgi:cadmium resistance protein CadD (predicted permease)